jgi:hypothetical protein
MTEAERKLMQKNAENGYDETEKIKANMISNGVHRRFSLDAENATVRNLLDILILVVIGDPITDEQREEFAKRIEEYRAYSRYVKWRKEQSKWELSGTSTSVDEETKETLTVDVFDVNFVNDAGLVMQSIPTYNGSAVDIQRLMYAPPVKIGYTFKSWNIPTAATRDVTVSYYDIDPLADGAVASGFSFSVSGLVNEGDLATLGTPTYGGDATKETAAGTYTLTVTIPQHTNYEFEYVDGTVVITAS